MVIMATEEMCRYFELQIRIETKNYVGQLPDTHGIGRTDLVSRMESWNSWSGKDSIRIKVKQELPGLELAFQRIKEIEIPRLEKEFRDAEDTEFRSTVKGNKDGDYILDSRFTSVKTGLPILMPLRYSQDKLFVPIHWDYNKRIRFIAYVKHMYPSHVKAFNVIVEKTRHRYKMDKFRRLEKEKEEHEVFKRKASSSCATFDLFDS